MKEALMLAREALKTCEWVDDGGNGHAEYDTGKVVAALMAIEALAQPKQKPVAMKFKIYLPVKHQINNAELPWVYDQDRSSGNVASMWVTPVATLPPQRTWVGLTEHERMMCRSYDIDEAIANAEAKLKEKNT